jgi:ribosome-binding protein aMBF1 (putative translation factor)
MDERDNILMSRSELARRWRMSVESIKRRERSRMLRPIRLDGRVVRYRLSDVMRVEEQAKDQWEAA